MQYDIRLIAFPNSILKSVAKPVFESELEDMKMISSKMIDIMIEGKGIGLAGPQVNILKRIIVVQDNDKYITLLNPEIIKERGFNSIEEGCLSLKGLRIKVKRSSTITVKYIGLDGKEKVLEAGSILSIALQHEIDHLHGLLIVDKVGPLKDMYIKKYLKGAKL